MVPVFGPPCRSSCGLHSVLNFNKTEHVCVPGYNDDIATSSYSVLCKNASVETMWSRLREGLQMGGLFGCMQQNSLMWREAFTYVGYNKLTFDKIAQMFQPKLSPVGTAARISESRTLAYWRDWLLDLTGINSIV